MIPFDILGMLHQELLKDRREPDGLLHCSSDLLGSLRHAQLTLAGAPRNETNLVSDVRLKTGTFWHRYFNELLIGSGVTVSHEVKVTPWLPKGWSGTADHLIWDDKKRAFVLSDLKTTKGEGMRYLDNGAKEEHLWQLSAYYHALVAGKFPMVKGFTIIYLPMNEVPKEPVEPTLVECLPLPKEQIWGVMEDRWARTEEYLGSIEAGPHDLLQNPAYYVTERLAPPMERVQRLFWLRDKWEVKLVPHWLTAYCPFPDELCDCNTQGITKIGAYYPRAEGTTFYYQARKGYEDIEPLVAPAGKSTLRQAA